MESIKKRVIRVSAMVALVMGVVFILNSLSSMTGYVFVNEKVGQGASSLIGLVLVVVGVSLSRTLKKKTKKHIK